MTTITPPPAEDEARCYVFDGLRLNGRGEPQIELRVYDEVAEEFGRSITFKPDRKAFAGMVPGFSYRIPTREEGDQLFLTFGKRRDPQPIRNAEMRQALALAHRAAETVLASSRRAAQLARSDLDLNAALRAVIPEYRKLRTASERIAFEMLVLDALRGVRVR